MNWIEENANILKEGGFKIIRYNMFPFGEGFFYELSYHNSHIGNFKTLKKAKIVAKYIREG